MQSLWICNHVAAVDVTIFQQLWSNCGYVTIVVMLPLWIYNHCGYVPISDWICNELTVYIYFVEKIKVWSMTGDQ